MTRLRSCACLTEEVFHFSQLFQPNLTVYSVSMYLPFSGSSHRNSRTGRNGSSVLRGPAEAEQAHGSPQPSPPAGFRERHHWNTHESCQVSGIKEVHTQTPNKICTWHEFLYEHCTLIWLRQHLMQSVTLFTAVAFSLGANTWQHDCCPRSPLEHKPQMKTYICTELLWSLIEIPSMWDKYSEKSGVRGDRDLIIVSSVIIPPRACENTHRFFFFFFSPVLQTIYTYSVRAFPGHSEQLMW